MRIAVIGGHDRGERALTRVAARCGHDLEFHTGHVGGRGADEIRAIVGRADVTIVLTDINSHGAVKVARVAGQKSGREVVLTKRLGLRRLAEMLDRGDPLDPLKLAS
jgi:hypothetical protein